MGQTEVNLNQMDCDFYISSLRKWFFSPPGCAFLYFKDVNHARKYLQPNYISWGYKMPVSQNFIVRGTCDKTSYFFVADSIRYHLEIFGGLKFIQNYVGHLLDEATEMLVREWKTGTAPVDPSLEAPYMRNILLPPFENYPSRSEEEGWQSGERLIKDLVVNHQVNALIVCVNSVLYCRISAFVYSTMQDFISLKDAVLEIKN